MSIYIYSYFFEKLNKKKLILMIRFDELSDKPFKNRLIANLHFKQGVE
jgi:hypothetical protein